MSCLHCWRVWRPILAVVVGKLAAQSALSGIDLLYSGRKNKGTLADVNVPLFAIDYILDYEQLIDTLCWPNI